jgi:alpha-ribazole phosphatase
MDFGHWEGLRWNDIGEAAIGAWAHDLARHAPGDGESLAQMLQRVHEALQDALSSDSEHMVWICHAGVARCAQWLLQHGHRLPQSHEWTLPAPAYGQWLQLELS